MAHRKKGTEMTKKARAAEVEAPVEAIVVTADPGSAPVASSSSGAMALANMSEEAFQARLASVKKGQDRIRKIQKSLMIGPTKEDPAGEDYGIIPGTKKPTLLKPGAEKLCAFYGLVATFAMRTDYGDGSVRPWITVNATAHMHLGSADGPIVGEGYGTANSSESKHRYRSAKRACPACGSVGSIMKSKYPDRVTGDLGWYCRDCKANFSSSDTAITQQELGQIVNPDPADVENTALKIAKKRAFIDGTLTTTATSGLFTQDMEDVGAQRHAPPVDAAPNDAPEPPPEDDQPEWTNGRSGPEKKAPAAKPAQAASPADSKCPDCGALAHPAKYQRKDRTHWCDACQSGFAGGAQ
jgi:hypothetical protein